MLKRCLCESKSCYCPKFCGSMFVASQSVPTSRRPAVNLQIMEGGSFRKLLQNTHELEQENQKREEFEEELDLILFAKAYGRSEEDSTQAAARSGPHRSRPDQPRRKTWDHIFAILDEGMAAARA